MVAALLSSCAPITRAPASALHHRRVCAVRCDAQPTERARRDIPLPGNQGLLLDRTAHDHDVVCAPAGQSWVLQRPRRGGPGLVLSSRLTGLQLADAPAALPKQSCVALAAVEDSVQGDVSVFGATDWYDITDYQLLDGVESGIDRQLADACSSAASECLGLVLREDASRVQSKEEVSPLSKRRTRKVRFTCNVCGETSTKAVSPHAWASGSVFARCDGCRVIHKLVDNLKLFHELSGPVFPPRKISTLRIPPGLPQQPTMDHHMHPGIWDPDNEDAP